MNRDAWPALKDKLTRVFKTKTRDEWCARFEGTEVCYAPVLGLAEAPRDAHNRAREAFVEVDGIIQPAPLPRFSRTRAGPARHTAPAGTGSAEALRDWGIDEAQ